MKKISIFTLLMFLALGFQTAQAQFTITIPKLPKIKKPKVEIQTQPTPDVQTNGEDAVSVEDSTSDQETSSQNSSGEDDTMDFRLSFFLEEIEKARQSVEKYNPDDYLYLVSDSLSIWLWRAVSMQEREKWTKEWLKKPIEQKKFAEALDSLAASAAKKLPGYTLNTKNYGVHNAAEEKMMKSVLKNPADYKIYYTGLKQANWLIDKNNLGIPTSRYKHGAIWLRDTTKDHEYCYISYVNIIQDYAGGGTYGASYAYFVKDEMVGCPAK